MSDQPDQPSAAATVQPDPIPDPIVELVEPPVETPALRPFSHICELCKGPIYGNDFTFHATDGSYTHNVCP